MRYFVVVILILMVLPTTVLAQGTEQANYGIKFKGFVKTDMMIDSRATVTAREGHFLLYPSPEALDANGDDLNETPNTNLLSIQTRLTGAITAPDAFGAKVSGVVEGAFFGHSNGDVNGFRLRHAFIKLDWQTSALMIGQYWHPMFITEVFPGTVSFNTGVPFQPLSRNPQIRYTRQMNDLHLTLTAASQRDFANTGPDGTTSMYLRNAVIPILDLNLKLKTDLMVIGAGANFKSLMPRTSYEHQGQTYSTDEKISSLSLIAFAKINAGKMTLKAEGIYGQNMTDLLMLGGYAVKATDADGEEYTNINTMAVWGELIYQNSKALKSGLFVGYTQNLGADDDVMGAYYARGVNIDNVMRVAPRLEYQIGKTRFAAEVEYTSAAYGTTQLDGTVEDTTSVANIRSLLAAYLFF